MTKLVKSTQEGRTKWERALGAGSYQCRLGDFVIMMSGNSSAYDVTVQMSIKRLNGGDLANFSSSPYGSLTLFGRGVSDSARAMLGQLFSYVDTRSDDIEELINLID